MDTIQLQPEQKRLPLALRRGWQWRGGIVLACVLAGLLLWGFPLWGALAWALGLGLLGALELRVGERAETAISRVLFALMPPMAYTLVEILNYNNPWTDFSALQICLNLAWYYLLALAFYLAGGRRNLAAKLAVAVGWAWGMANHYVISFRGRTIFHGDFLTLRTAANVAGNYDYTPDLTQVVTGLVLLGCLLLISLLPRRKGRGRIPLKLALPALGVGAAFLVLFFSTNFLSWAGIEPSMWTTRGNGLALNFSVCLRYSRVDAPEGYSEEALAALRTEHPSDSAAVPAAGDGEQRPVNLIVIMNESFSDLGVIPGVEANRDWMPFWRSLSENTIKGYAYASVFGGTTANSEYEFLTGNTTAFLPAGTVPFQMYVSDGDPSLVSQMKALGYATLAMHPYLSSGWNRIPVYNDFGFDRYMFEWDFTNRQYMRNYVTDRSDYENLIAQYEAKQPGQPMFIFNVTMQNHSAYNVPWSGLEKTTWLTGRFENRFSTVDQYLSLIYQSDLALEYLLDYFSRVEEPTMVVMFGDHQPQVATNFYTEALGGGAEGLDTATAQLKQMVPFLIWANYDIPEADGVELSLNYLSTLVAKTANLPLTGYQKFLDALYRDVPVVNAVGFRDAQGNWAAEQEQLGAQARGALERYRELLYNNIFDKNDRIDGFFDLSE